MNMNVLKMLSVLTLIILNLKGKNDKEPFCKTDVNIMQYFIVLAV